MLQGNKNSPLSNKYIFLWTWYLKFSGTFSDLNPWLSTTSVLLQMKHEELRHLSAGPKGFDDLRRKSKNIHKILNSSVLWLDCRIPFILLICQDSEVSLQELSNTF